MRDGIRVADINGAIGQDGAKESANDALSLIRPPNVAIADVEDDKRVNLRGSQNKKLQLQTSVNSENLMFKSS